MSNVERRELATTWTLHQPEWRKITALEYAAMGYTLANDPDRREIIYIQADDGTELLSALRDIVRPAHDKPSKGHAEALRERPQGQRVRCSSELPDHVGRVFVTAVPNVPIQVMGRRDPATGELCVGSIGTPQKD